MKKTLTSIMAIALVVSTLLSACTPAKKPNNQNSNDVPKVFEPRFGKYNGENDGVDNGYVWDNDQNAFVTKEGGNGDSAYYTADGTPLTVDYSFFADVSFENMIKGGGFYLDAKINKENYIRFGIEAGAENKFDVFSLIVKDGKEVNKLLHLTDQTYADAVKMGVIVSEDAMLMTFGGNTVYKRSLYGVASSTLVVSGANNMVAQIRNIEAENDSAAVVSAFAERVANYNETVAALLGDTSVTYKKFKEDKEKGTFKLIQKSNTKHSPLVAFYENGNEVFGRYWAVSGTIRAISVPGESGHLRFSCYQDDNNVAHIYINRRPTKDTSAGSNGIWQHIIQNGVRMPSKNNEHVSENLADSTDWTANFIFLYRDGIVELHLQEQGEEMMLMTRYTTSWENTFARFELVQNADAEFSNINATANEGEVEKLYRELNGITGEVKASAKILFIGNSATSNNDIPGTLSRLAGKAGYYVEYASMTKGGATLSDHADASSEHGKSVLEMIKKGYDYVYIQDNGNCISSSTMRNASKKAAKALNTAIKASGAKTGIYIRPPYGYMASGFEPFDQCREFDKHFTEISAEIGAENAYVNRAFAYAMKNTDYNLWGSDNAHTSAHGAYLAVCVFFCTVFDTSCEVLGTNGLPEADARALQKIADKIVIEGNLPW